MKNRRLVLLKDLNEKEFTIDPFTILKIVECGNNSIVETIDGNITVINNKLSIENAIENCKLP